MKKRVLIIEDEAIIAEEIKSTLNLLNYECVGHAMNGDKALDLFATKEADLVLLDISIKGTLSGIDLAKILSKKYSLPYIYITSFSDETTLNAVKETSPYGYIVKPFTSNDLKVNIDLALDRFARENAKNGCSKSFLSQKFNVSLTEREYDVLLAFKDGLTYRATGERLFISLNTVKTYQKRLFQLFDVSSKYELMEKLRQ